MGLKIKYGYQLMSKNKERIMTVTISFTASQALVWNDVFGMIIHVDFANDGSDHDMSIFNESEVVINKDTYFS